MKIKALRSLAKRRGAGAKMSELDSEYGSVLDMVGNLPLNKTEADSTDATLKSFMWAAGAK